MSADLNTVRARFEKDRFASSNGCRIEEVSHHHAVCSMPVSDGLLNAIGSVMGGAIFTLADFAFAVASNWDQSFRVSQSVQISFLSAPKGTRLIAEAAAVKEGRSTCLYTVTIRDDLGRDVAFVTVNGFVMQPSPAAPGR